MFIMKICLLVYLIKYIYQNNETGILYNSKNEVNVKRTKLI